MSEHIMQGIGWSGPEKGTLRVRCSCGWTEKTSVVDPGEKSREENILRFFWERHAYTDTEMMLLHELEGCEICARERS